MPGGSLIAPVFGLIISILAFSMLLNSLLGRSEESTPQALAPELDAYDREASVAATWTREELYALAQTLAEHLTLEIEPISDLLALEGEFYAQDNRPIIGGRYIFRIAHVKGRELVPGVEIEAFHASFKVENFKKGVFLTNGFFSEDAVYQSEDRPVEILNRNAIQDWSQSAGFDLPGAAPLSQNQGTTDEQSEI